MKLERVQDDCTLNFIQFADVTVNRIDILDVRGRQDGRVLWLVKRSTACNKSTHYNLY
jgi:hypothetical protein